MALALVLMIQRLVLTMLALILVVHGQALELTVPALLLTLLSWVLMELALVLTVIKRCFWIDLMLQSLHIR